MQCNHRLMVCDSGMSEPRRHLRCHGELLSRKHELAHGTIQNRRDGPICTIPGYPSRALSNGNVAVMPPSAPETDSNCKPLKLAGIHKVLRWLAELLAQNRRYFILALDSGSGSHDFSIPEINGKWQFHEG